jgi:hypothetical protein
LATTPLAGLSFNGLDGIAPTARGLLCDAQKGFAFVVDTTQAKEFAFAHWLVNGADGGRLFVRCFGGEGTVRENAAGDVLASLNRRMTVQLGDAVVFAQIGVVGLDGQIELEALRLYGLRQVAPVLVCGTLAGNVVGKPDRRGNLYPAKQRPEQKIDAAVDDAAGPWRRMATRTSASSSATPCSDDGKRRPGTTRAQALTSTRGPAGSRSGFHTPTRPARSRHPGTDPSWGSAKGERSPYASIINKKRAPVVHAAGALWEVRHT